MPWANLKDDLISGSCSRWSFVDEQAEKEINDDAMKTHLKKYFESYVKLGASATKSISICSYERRNINQLSRVEKMKIARTTLMNSLRVSTIRIFCMVAMTAMSQPALAQDATSTSATFANRIAKLEQVVFGKSDYAMPLEMRLKALESNVFGAIKTGSATDRIDALNSFLLESSVKLESSPALVLPKSSVSPPIVAQPVQNREQILVDVGECNCKSFDGFWTGWLSGNDPQVRIGLFLECRDNELTGYVTWTSPRSGTSKRALKGSYFPESKSVIIKDDHLMLASPQPNWIFCPVVYQLTISGRELAGRFWSDACRDKGTFRVARQ